MQESQLDRKFSLKRQLFSLNRQRKQLQTRLAGDEGQTELAERKKIKKPRGPDQALTTTQAAILLQTHRHEIKRLMELKILPDLHPRSISIYLLQTRGKKGAVEWGLEQYEDWLKRKPLIAAWKQEQKRVRDARKDEKEQELGNAE